MADYAGRASQSARAHEAAATSAMALVRSACTWVAAVVAHWPCSATGNDGMATVSPQSADLRRAAGRCGTRRRPSQQSAARSCGLALSWTGLQELTQLWPEHRCLGVTGVQQGSDVGCRWGVARSGAISIGQCSDPASVVCDITRRSASPHYARAEVRADRRFVSGQCAR